LIAYEECQSHVERQVRDLHRFSNRWKLDGAMVWGDSGRIERALLNLSFNAIEAVGLGGRVWVRCEKGDDGMIAIFVEDNGPGISPSALSKLFNPFFTTKENGTGLGLAIVHSIAVSHGGSVRAGSRPGGGASFVLTLPAEKPLKSIGGPSVG
jgi:signal transduction histidine kinase